MKTINHFINQRKRFQINFLSFFSFDTPEEIERSWAESSSICLDKLDSTFLASKDFKTINSYCTLTNISLKINKGELICISGKHMSGKSTLIKSILGETLLIDNDTLGKQYFKFSSNR